MMPLEILSHLLHAINNMLIFPTTLQGVFLSHSMSYHDKAGARAPTRSLDDLGAEATQLFRAGIDLPRMLSMSAQMRRRYVEQLQKSPDCMLPSYCHTLPTGQEKGAYLALDVGGSTFRVALVDLNGRHAGIDAVRIRRMAVVPIDNRVRRLPSADFFDWMAEKIQAMLADEPDVALHDHDGLAVGLAWSFPIDQTSLKGGKVRGMGKGFCGHTETIGRDLGELIVHACRQRGIHVRVDAILNDSSATLLSQAYREPSTSMGLIVGTGVNAAVHLPTSCVGADKFGDRDPAWYARAQKVITNTELSMFGKGILPETRWDESLNKHHLLPDFQPLEYMTTGRYLGEIMRLVLIEAVETAQLFGGRLPTSLQEPYSLDTVVLAKLEMDQSATDQPWSLMIQDHFHLDTAPSDSEVRFLRTIAQAISYRASAYLAVAIHALWSLQKATDTSPASPHGIPKTSIACNGSVILKYPGLKARCQAYIADMIASESEATGVFQVEQVVLEPADEAAILGAAVAAACSDAD